MSRLPADGTHGQAERYLGPCAGCPVAIGFGDLWVMRDGKRYHVDPCDPTPDAVICGWCHTEVVREPGNINRFPCHDGDCYRLYMSFFVWFWNGLAEHLNPHKPPKWGRPDDGSVVRYGPVGGADVKRQQRQEAWRRSA